MSDTTEILEQKTHFPHLTHNQNNTESNESFTISAEEAAEILGVNRSRLSQLTSKGIFSFEKRKIDTRNRLFYKLSDLLNHQRNQYQSSQNYFPNNQQEKTLPIEQINNNNYLEEKPLLIEKQTLKKSFQSKNFNLKTAKELYESEQIKDKNSKINDLIINNYSHLLEIKEQINKTLKFDMKEKNNIQNKLEQLEIKTQNILNKIAILDFNMIKQNKEQNIVAIEKKVKKNWKNKTTKFIPTLPARR
ncbi:hypothetical protein ACWNT8_10900 [Pigmentibacter ruber]|nr:hypothetical protein GTC16762_18080 [Pigmentibacter ruber]